MPDPAPAPKEQKVGHGEAAFIFEGKEYAARLTSAATVETAIVFVHGFTGHPFETWTDFHSMMDTHAAEFPYWKNADAYFFTYHDVVDSLDDSVDILDRFVASLYPSTQGSLHKIPSREAVPTRNYSKLILVGHSEGGVVIRSTIANAGRVHESDTAACPMLNAHVVLFAPAHFGFVPTGWLGALFTLAGIKSIFRFVVAASTPATEMFDKTVLKQIMDLTRELYLKAEDVPAYTAHVLFGTNERFVVREYYLHDCRHKPEPKKEHSDVCKPNFGYKRPLKILNGD